MPPALSSLLDKLHKGNSFYQFSTVCPNRDTLRVLIKKFHETGFVAYMGDLQINWPFSVLSLC